MNGGKSMFNKIKKTMNKFLETLAKQNKELYGSERMDCCNLNKTNDTSIRK
jgi:hypothetical protein